MDDEEENNLCPYGTPLEPLEEDEIPSKKPIAIEDQVVTDDHGRRRFHGAFTGGFSAGFWNTVGSLEGWKPQSFKSSRSEKAKQQAQKPIDFMDDEDLGEFGIAPQRIQTTDDFTPQDVIDKNVRKRKLQQQSTGPIPGIPVLHQLLIPAKENVAIRLLKKMGWKEGQGIGARQTRKEKKITSGRNARERYVAKKYGCDLGPLSEQKNQSDDQSEEDDDEDDSDNEEITFAPDDFDPYVCAIKDNTFGLGYKGLDSNLLTGTQRHIDLFGNKFEIMGKNNRKLSIRGQAFGVGALEEEDEDIYAPDDMTKYDFSLEEKKKTKTRKEEKPKEFCIEGFCSAKSNPNSSKTIFVVKIPPGFKPRNWAIRKSRFEPLSEQQMQLIKQQDEYKTKGLGRHDLDPQQRGNILNETSTTKTSSISTEEDKDSKTTYLQKINEKYESKTDKSDKIDTTAGENNSVISLDEDTRKENEKVQNEAKKITQKINTKLGPFKPFINYEAKQARYEKFVEANLRDDEEIKKFLKSIQPLSMSEWDSELEKKEFLQARNIYKPLTGLMSDRFVSEATILAEKEIEKPALTVDKNNNFERTKITWKPCAQLCKRFNVIEPFGGTLIEEKKEKKPKFSVFDYLEISVNRKDNFVTPVIVPKKTEKPAPIISQKLDENKKEEKINLINANKTSISRECANEKDDNSKSTNPNVSASSLNKAELKQKSRKPKTDLEKKIEETKDKHPSEKKDIFKSIFENFDDEEEEKEQAEGKQEEMNESSSSSVKFVSTDANSSISKDIYATLTTKSATELNILRNTSPPRGIFANLFAKKPHDIVSSSSENCQSDSQMKCSTVDNASQSIIKPSTSSTKTKISEINSVDPVTISKVNKSNNDMDDLQYGPKLPTTHIETASNLNVMENDKNIISEDSSSDSADSLDEKLLNVLKKSKFDSRKKSKIIEEWVEKSDLKSDNESRKKKKKKKDKKKNKKHKKNKKSKR